MENHKNFDILHPEKIRRGHSVPKGHSPSQFGSNLHVSHLPVDPCKERKWGVDGTGLGWGPVPPGGHHFHRGLAGSQVPSCWVVSQAEQLLRIITSNNRPIFISEETSSE